MEILSESTTNVIQKGRFQVLGNTLDAIIFPPLWKVIGSTSREDLLEVFFVFHLHVDIPTLMV
ncbi:MAG: hypothetical protein EBZ67_13880 [Chitinophagia bacterium]|nr:hypothetical protein [Chitinophagia bacterium]